MMDDRSLIPDLLINRLKLEHSKTPAINKIMTLDFSSTGITVQITINLYFIPVKVKFV